MSDGSRYGDSPHYKGRRREPLNATAGHNAGGKGKGKMTNQMTNQTKAKQWISNLNTPEQNEAEILRRCKNFDELLAACKDAYSELNQLAFIHKDRLTRETAERLQQAITNAEKGE